MSSPSITLSCSNAPNDINQKLVFTLNISGVSLANVSNISNIVLVLNDENADQANSSTHIQYIPIAPLLYTSDLWNNQNISIVKTVTSVVIGRHYTARATLEFMNGTLYKSSTLVNLQAYTSPLKPSFDIRSFELTDPLDCKFGLYISNLSDFTDASLSSVKFIWHSIKGNNDGEMDFKIFNYNSDNLYIVDISDSLLTVGHSETYEISCVVRNFVGESPVSDTRVLNATNIPDALTGFVINQNSSDPAASDDYKVVSRVVFNKPTELGSDLYTYAIHYNTYLTGETIPSISSEDLMLDVSNIVVGSTTVTGMVYFPISVYAKNITASIKAISSTQNGALSDQSSFRPVGEVVGPITITDTKVGPLTSLYEPASSSSSALTDGSNKAFIFVSDPNLLMRGGTFHSIEVFDATTNNLYTSSYNASENLVTVSGLTNGTSYNFVVKVKQAYSGAVNGILGQASVSVPATPFTFSGSPSILSTVVGDQQVRVFLSSVSSPVSSVTYQYRLNNGQWVDVLLDPSDSFTLTGLTNGEVYSVTVRTNITVNSQTYYSSETTSSDFVPIGNSGIGSVSMGLSSYVGPRTVSGNNVIAVLSTDSSSSATYDGTGSITLVWSVPSDADLALGDNVSFARYEILVDDNVVHTITNKNVDNYTVTSGLVNGTSYSVSMNVVTVTVIGSIENYVSVTNNVVINIVPFTWPVAPVFNGVTELNTTLALSIAEFITHPQSPAIAGGTFFNIRYKLASSPDSAYSLWTPASVYSQYTDLDLFVYGLQNGFIYTVQVRANVVIDNLEYSGYYFTQSNLVPVGPTNSANVNLNAFAGPRDANLSPVTLKSNLGTAGVVNGDGTVDLQWNNLTDAELEIDGTVVSFYSYMIYQDESLLSEITNRSTTLLNVSSLTNGSTYYFDIDIKLVTSSGTYFTKTLTNNSVSSIPFTFPNDITDLVSAARNAAIDLNWTSELSHDSYTLSYLVKNTSNQTLYDNNDGYVALLTIDGVNPLVNGVTYNGTITPSIVVNGVRYNSTPAAWSDTPFANPVASTFTAVPLDNAIRVTLDNSTNNVNGYTFNAYNIKIFNTETSTNVFTNSHFVPNLSMEFQVIDISANGNILNGVTYRVEVFAKYSAGLNNINSETGIVYNIIPYGQPIIDAALTQFMKFSGNVILRYNPNGRATTKIVLVAIPNYISSEASKQVSYYYDVPNLPTAIRGNQQIELTSDVFGYRGNPDPDIQIASGYAFVVTEGGVASYTEPGSTGSSDV